MVRWSRAWSVILIGLWPLLSACAAQQFAPVRSTGAPSVEAKDATTGGPVDTGWQPVDTALEFRQVRLTAGQQSGDVSIIRLDPTAYHIRVAYDTANAGRVSEWAAAVKPVALINGGFFDAEKKATALVIFDGIVRGESYEGFGGMVVINSDGAFELRSLRQQPYDPQEPLRQAMQSAPMLIQPGGTISDLEADDERARRSAIARDTSGRILLIACDWPAFTLDELATLLKESDLEIDAALNLDGGRSTGLYLQTPGMRFLMDSFDSVPLVLVVDKRS